MNVTKEGYETTQNVCTARVQTKKDINRRWKTLKINDEQIKT